MERFHCKTKLISGAGSIAALGMMQIGRLFVVTDPFFRKNGQADRIAALANAEKTEFFDKVAPDPSVELVAQATAQMRALSPDTVLALGGGSAMDCAKAAVYFSGQSVRLIAVPTTSGSGSEVTDFAILTHDKVKHPLVDKRLIPDVAILDGDLVRELPASLVADTGFDALSHTLEAYVAKNAGAVSDALAADAFCTVYAALPASFSGNTQVRQKLHTASAMAGIAFSTAGLGVCHAMSHALGGMFHVPHGRLNAILLPSVIACNAHFAGEKYAKLARLSGIGGSVETIAVRNLIHALVRLRRELHLPETLAQASVEPSQVRAQTKTLVQTVLSDPCCASNPVTVEDFMVRKILDEVTGRV